MERGLFMHDDNPFVVMWFQWTGAVGFHFIDEIKIKLLYTFSLNVERAFSDRFAYDKLCFHFRVFSADIDGVSQVDLLMNNGPSARDEFVYNVDQYLPYTFGNAIR